MSRTPLLRTTPDGLFCEAGGFYIDPWEPVERAVITHAHADHARAGSAHYLAADDARHVMRVRLGEDADVTTVAYGERVRHGDVDVSLHPAGHVLGSAQVRVERGGEVWVVSGDYKLQDDPTCAPFEPVACDVFITECTFGLPIYRWQPSGEVMADVNAWWRRNVEQGRTSLLLAYALGKAQRLLAGLDPAIGPILVHGAVRRLNEAYDASGVRLPATRHADADAARETKGAAMVVAPPSMLRSPWMRKFDPVSVAMASGWMQVRGPRRIRAVDRGFALSDHVDWNGIVETIEATGARRIGLTHGRTSVMSRWLQERGFETEIFATRWEGEEDEVDVDHE